LLLPTRQEPDYAMVAVVGPSSVVRSTVICRKLSKIEP